MPYLKEKKNHQLHVLVPQMDEEGQKVGPTKLMASLMLSKDQQCMVSAKFWRKISVSNSNWFMNMGFVCVNIIVYKM